MESTLELSNTKSLAQTMKTSQGRFLLTINDHPDMREMFRDFRTETVKINYTVGGAGTGNNRTELIVMNW